MDATVHLIRHGQVENPKGVIYGRLPGYNLSERGRNQAQAAAAHLAGAELGAVWSSPMERAFETAELVAAPHGLPITIDDRLTESATVLEGVGRNLLAFLRSPAAVWSLRNPLRPSWGETFEEVRARMMEVISEAVEKAGGAEVAFVSHQTPVLVARFALAKRNVPPWLGGAQCATGSVTTIVVEDGKVVSAAYFAPTAL